MKSRRMKGDVKDLMFIAVICIALGIVAMVGYLILQAWGQAAPIVANPQTAATVVLGKEALALAGNSVLFLMIAFGLASIISAFYTDTHPVFFIFSVISFGITVMVVSIFSGVFIEIADSSQFLPVASQFYMMIETIRNFPVLAVMIGALIILALYVKRSDLRLGGGMA